jgi:hypothetical protein
MSLASLLRETDPRRRSAQWNERVIREADETARATVGEEIKRDVRRQNRINPKNTFISTVVGAITGGPIGAVSGLISAPRGDDKPLESAFSSFQMGNLLKGGPGQAQQALTQSQQPQGVFQQALNLLKGGPGQAQQGQQPQGLFQTAQDQLKSLLSDDVGRTAIKLKSAIDRDPFRGSMELSEYDRLRRKEGREDRAMRLKEKQMDLSKQAKLSETEKAVMSQITQGKARLYSDLTESEKQAIPEQAIFDVGFRDDKIKMVRTPKIPSGEASQRINLIKQSANDLGTVLDSIESGEMSYNQIRLSKAPGAFLGLSGLLGNEQAKQSNQIKAVLQGAVEGLARGLTGSAMPESEVKRFQRLFGIDATDNDEIIQFKIERSKELGDMIFTSSIYGYPIDVEKLQEFNSQSEKVLSKMQEDKDKDENLLNNLPNPG